MTPFVWLWLFLAGWATFELSMNLLVLPMEHQLENRQGNFEAYLVSGTVSVLGLDAMIIGLVKASAYAHSIIGMLKEREVRKDYVK